MFRKTHRLRLLLLAIVCLLTFGAIEARLYYLQVLSHETYASRAEYQQHKRVRLSPRRGEILDRNGVLLAGSHMTQTIILDTRRMNGPADRRLIEDLANAMGRPVDRVADYFERPARRYVYRKAPDEVIRAVEAVQSSYQLPAQVIQFETTSKREYPHGSLAAHLLGFTIIDDYGSDNIGGAGLELVYNDWLDGEYRDVRRLVNGAASRRELSELSDEAIHATFGHDIVLTIDQRIQMLTETALARSVNRFQAKGGVAVVMDVRTGDILALANCPDFDLNTFRDQGFEADQLRNRALTDPIEVGSVMKIITAALLIDHGLLSVDELIDCKGGVMRIAGRTIRDTHHSTIIPFRTAFAESSNVAMAWLADTRLETRTFYDGLVRFGLGRPTGINLPGEGGGILYPPNRWTAMSKASLAIGYETALTPLQVVTAVGAIANNGWRMKPRLVREIRNFRGETIQKFPPETLGRVVSAETCQTMLQLMEGVVLEGTASREGTVPGYRVGGKTGTTVKHVEDEDGNRLYVASFAGIAPIDDPRIVVYVYVDEPQGKRYGGDVAAPVFREIVEEALPLLGVAPSDPVAWETAQIAKRQGRPDELLAAVRPAVEENELQAAMAVDPDDEFGPDVMPLLPDSETLVADASAPRMPDLRGMTLIEAWETVGRRGIDARMLGSGTCVSQDPPPGAVLPPGRQAKVIFSPGLPELPTVQQDPLPLELKVR